MAGNAPRRQESLPAIFCLEENRDEVVAFLDSLRSRFALNSKIRSFPRRPGRVRKIGKYFDFSAIKNITPAAALVLAAEYDRAHLRQLASVMVRASHAGKNIDPDAYRLSLIDIDRWSPQVVRTLGQLGFFQLLDFEEFVPEVPERDEYILEFVSGNNVDSEATAELTTKLRELLTKLQIPNEEIAVHLQGRIIDAIQNVRDHAYPHNISWRYPPIGRWWLTASVDAIENRLDLIVYDQGITIPGSIPISPKRALITSAFRKIFNLEEDFTNSKYDGKAIKAAIETGQSGTDKEYRGRGLIFMRDLVNFCDRGELRILSRFGAYLYRSDGVDEEWFHETSIGGTLIEWRLYLDGGQREGVS